MVLLDYSNWRWRELCVSSTLTLTKTFGNINVPDTYNHTGMLMLTFKVDAFLAI